MVEALEAKGFRVVDRTGFGTPEILRKALEQRRVDLILDYTGAGQFYYQGYDPALWSDPVKGFETIRRLDRAHAGIVWLTPSPANNAEAIAVRRDFAEVNHLVTLEDFARYVNAGKPLKLVSPESFARSRFGLAGMQKAYGFSVREDQLMFAEGHDAAAMLASLAEGKDGVNASFANATDGGLEKLGLVVLEDPKSVPTAFRPAPVIRAEVLASYPEIEGLLSPVFASLGLNDLQHLNAQVAYYRLAARDVARDYLVGKGLLKR